jgi:hypothetical protein
LFSASRFAAVSFALILLTSIGASAQFGVPLNHTDPRLEPVTLREMVARYCRLDYAGARLSPADWPKLQPIVAWPTNPDFSLFMVTARFDVDAELAFEHGKYSVMVHYRSLGKFDLSEGYSEDPAEQIQNVLFTISEVNGDWRITSVEPNYPHPSRAAALQWVNLKLSQTTDPATKPIYQHALNLLQTPKSSPQPK